MYTLSSNFVSLSGLWLYFPNKIGKDMYDETQSQNEDYLSWMIEGRKFSQRVFYLLDNNQNGWSLTIHNLPVSRSQFFSDNSLSYSLRLITAVFTTSLATWNCNFSAPDLYIVPGFFLFPVQLFCFLWRCGFGTYDRSSWFYAKDYTQTL